MTQDLVTFLGARLADDELKAKAGGFHFVGCARFIGPSYPCTCEYSARVLRDVEAKRALLEEHREVNGECITCVYAGDDEDSGGNMRRYREHEDFPCTTVQLLALPYADHPDYRDEWRP